MAEAQPLVGPAIRFGARKLRWLAATLRIGRIDAPINLRIIADNLRMNAAEIGATGCIEPADRLMQMVKGLEVMAAAEPFERPTSDEQSELAGTFERFADRLDRIAESAPAAPGGAA